MTTIDGFWAVIPAGGAGTRLWPLSRAGAPKFLLDLTGTGRTLLQGTWDRLAPLCGDRVVVVTGQAHREAVAAQLPDLAASRLVAEPSPRDSMAAIGLAAAMLEREDPDAVLGSFAADHVIADVGSFRDCVREAAAIAADREVVVTVGIEPTHPSTAFGYIRMGEAMEGAATARSVVEFVEKPDAERATSYVASGEFRWNAGMFVVRARVLLDLLARWHPDLAAGLRAIAADPDSLAARWDGLEKIAIDHAVAEPAAALGVVAVVPGSFDWDDIGDFDALAGLAAGRALEDSPDLRVLGGGEVISVESTGLVVAGGGRPVAVVGLDDVVVVDTGDAVLVTTRARAQEVKKVVDQLKAQGRTDLL